MLLAALIVGGLTAYWLGLRPGAWAAVATFAVLLVATLVPPLALFLHVALAVAVLAVCIAGARRERPADAVRAVRWVRSTVSRLAFLARARSTGSNGRKRDDRDAN